MLPLSGRLLTWGERHIGLSACGSDAEHHSSGVQLTPFEIACGTVFDVEPEAPALAETPLAPFEALERAVLPALRRPPCVVSFSGGVDSSLVLSAAAAAARSEGLPLPVPVTLRFPIAPRAHEDEWQEGVIRHLGLTEWVRLTFDDELDLLGPVATRGLLRHGLLWPANCHFHVPIFELARGGATLTGYGGDHLLSAWPWRRHADVVSGRARPTPRDLLRLMFALAPAPLLRHRERRRAAERPWLTPQALEWSRNLEAVIATSQPRRWRRWLRWQMGTRRIRLAQASLSRLAADHEGTVHNPLLDPVFVAALVRMGPNLGLGDRNTIVRRVASDRLPPTLLARRTKASFADAFWGRHSRAFLAACDGRGIDRRLVEFEALRHEWTTRHPSFLTALLLQQAWLAGRP